MYPFSGNDYGGWYAKMRQQIKKQRRHVILEAGYSTEVRSEENSHDNDERKSGGDIYVVTWLQAFQVISQHWGRRTEGPRRDVSRNPDPKLTLRKYLHF